MTDVKERSHARTETVSLPIRKIGVVGAGQMGSGIAHVSSLAGFDVTLCDLTLDRVKAAIATINGNMARQVSRKRITEEERQAALKRITMAEKYDAFANCDIIIEAATEKEEVKRSGRSVEEASRVIDMDDVLLPMIASGFRTGQTLAKIARLISSFSVADSTMRSQSEKAS